MKKLLRYKESLKPFARTLRKEMTDCERMLWHRIRRKQLCGMQFYRQKPIGNFIVDFYCPSAKLVVEVDGGQHFSTAGRKSDLKRDGLLEALGLRVIRFTDLEIIQNLDVVCEMIHEMLTKQISPK